MSSKVTERYTWTQELVDSKVSISLDLKFVGNPYNTNILAGEFQYKANIPLKYSYIIKGKTADVDFTYDTEEYHTTDNIPVIGLYLDRTTEYELEFEDLSGNTLRYRGTITVDGSDVTALRTINIEVLDETVAEATINKGWFVTTWLNAYDKNGDLRMTGLYQWYNTPLKTMENNLICGDVTAGKYNNYVKRLYLCNLVGQVRKIFKAPEDTAVHHDVFWSESKQALYALTSHLEEGTEEALLESRIVKYDNIGRVIWDRDYSEYFKDVEVLANSESYDAHFNCIDYNRDLDQLLTDSRSTSTIIGIQESTGQIVWTIDDSDQKELVSETNLTVVNPETFFYPCGEHTSFYTRNPKYASYWGENKFVISVFDNVSCKLADGKDNLKPISEEYDEDYFAADFDSKGLIYAIDLNAKTVELLDVFEVPGERSEFRGSIEDTGDYYSFFMCDAKDYFIIDADNNVGVRALNMDTQLGYRGRIFYYEELRSLL